MSGRLSQAIHNNIQSLRLTLIDDWCRFCPCLYHRPAWSDDTGKINLPKDQVELPSADWFWLSDWKVRGLSSRGVSYRLAGGVIESDTCAEVPHRSAAHRFCGVRYIFKTKYCMRTYDCGRKSNQAMQMTLAGCMAPHLTKSMCHAALRASTYPYSCTREPHQRKRGAGQDYGWHAVRRASFDILLGTWCTGRLECGTWSGVVNGVALGPRSMCPLPVCRGECHAPDKAMLKPHISTTASSAAFKVTSFQ